MRGLLLLATAMSLVAGCGAPVDTTKVTYPRTTVPAGQLPPEATSGTGEARTDDPAFTPASLRALDPCALLDEDVLDEFGRPAEDNSRGGFAECANYMEDDDGEDLNITLSLGDSVPNAVDADQNIGGLPALENMLDTGEACFVTVVTSTSPNLGIAVQVSGNGEEELCAVARRMMASVVDRIRTDPPNYDLAKGTLIELDPCHVLDAADVTDAIGYVEASPFNVHWCNWSGDEASVSLWFRLGYAPSAGDGIVPVDLGGGVTAYQRKEVSSAASCAMEWKHRAFAGDQVEVVKLSLEVRNAEEDTDPCAPALTIAKTVLPALPKV